MPENEPATIAVFKWDADCPPLLPCGDSRRTSQDDGEEMTYLLSHAAAAAIFAALQRAGHVAADAALFHGEGGWHFPASNAGRTYSLFVHWTGIQDEDFLAIQSSLKRTWLDTLFRRPPLDAALPAKQMLSRVLDVLPEVSSLQWLTERQFVAAYRRGESLPSR